MVKRIFLMAAMAAVCVLSGAQTPSRQWAVVNTSSCFLRAKPDYESGLESQCLMGTVAEVTGSERYWRKVNVPDYKDVWTTSLTIALMSEAEKDAYIKAPKWVCTTELTYIYTEPSTASERISDFVMGDLVRSTGETEPGWVKILMPDSREGWVQRHCVKDFAEWSNDKAAVVIGAGESQEGLESLRKAVVSTAKRFVGTPYMWGGISPKHFDCSGLTKFVYMMNGIVLPRNAREQIQCGIEVSREDLQPGDLLFFGRLSADGKRTIVTHVAMYIGDGHIIHSSHLVRVNSIREGDPDYYDGNCLGARRIIGHMGEGVSIVTQHPWYF